MYFSTGFTDGKACESSIYGEVVPVIFKAFIDFEYFKDNLASSREKIYLDIQKLREALEKEPTLSAMNSKVVSGSNKRRGLPPLIPLNNVNTHPDVTLPELTSLFECPVCFDYVLSPIFQCQSGHLICSICRPKLTSCPTCRGPLGNIRNLAMEKVASTIKFPCKYSSSGCKTSLLHTDRAKHEEVCEFRPYVCPCPGAACKWEGSLGQVMPHLMTCHKSITTLVGEDIVFLATDTSLPGAVDWVMMQSCFGQHFLLVLKKQEKYDGYQQFFAFVQFIGQRNQAQEFHYRLELNNNGKRLTWEAVPRSIHEGIAATIMHSDCLIFDSSQAHIFEQNGNLGINVTIYRV